MRFRTWYTYPPLSVLFCKCTSGKVWNSHIVFAVAALSAHRRRLSSSAMGDAGAKSSVLCGRESKYPRSIGILVGYTFRIPTQQLACCYGIDFLTVAGIFHVSLVTELCNLSFIYLLLAVCKTSSFVYFNKKNGF